MERTQCGKKLTVKIPVIINSLLEIFFFNRCDSFYSCSTTASKRIEYYVNSYNVNYCGNCEHYNENIYFSSSIEEKMFLCILDRIISIA